MHTVKRVCTLVLTGLLALPMAAPAGAEAASFSDLPSSHWAYIAMTEAAGYGILQGTGANTMSPVDTVVEAQVCAAETLLVGQVPDTYLELPGGL